MKELLDRQKDSSWWDVMVVIVMRFYENYLRKTKDYFNGKLSLERYSRDHPIRRRSLDDRIAKEMVKYNQSLFYVVQTVPG